MKPLTPEQRLKRLTRAAVKLSGIDRWLESSVMQMRDVIRVLEPLKDEPKAFEVLDILDRDQEKLSHFQDQIRVLYGVVAAMERDAKGEAL